MTTDTLLPVTDLPKEPDDDRYKQVDTSFYDNFLMSIPGIKMFLFKPNVNKDKYRLGYRECSQNRETPNWFVNWIMFLLILGQLAGHLYTMVYHGTRSFCGNYKLFKYKDGKTKQSACQAGDALAGDTMGDWTHVNPDVADATQAELNKKDIATYRTIDRVAFGYESTLGLFLTVVLCMVMHWHVRRCNSQYALLYGIALQLLTWLIVSLMYTVYSAAG